MAKSYEDDDDRYDYDVKGPRWDPNSKYSEMLKRTRKEEQEEKERTRIELIKSKGEYIVPDEFDIDKYKEFVEKTLKDPNKKSYDDFDAKKLYYYMMALRHYYADVMFKFYSKFDVEKLKSLSAFTLGEISGNKLEFEEIKYDKEASKNNKEKFLANEKELIWQRKHFFEYQTHHERTLQALFNKKTSFQVLQQRGIEAKLMNEMYNQGFYIDLGIKPTKQIKKMYAEEGADLEDFYTFPIMKEILKEKDSKIKELKDRKEFLAKCRNLKKSLQKLKSIVSERETKLESFDLYKDSKYVQIVRNVIDNSLVKLDELIDKAELAEIHDYYDGVYVLKND